MIHFRRPSNTVIIVTGLITLAALLRIARHLGWLDVPPNVAPISAMAMVSGIFLPRRLTFVVPLAAMLLSDIVIGFYSLPVMIAVYGSFAVTNVIALRLRHRLNVRRLVAASVLGSLIFFFVTNAAVWAFQQMYPHNGAGLFQAYVAGLPYLRNTMIGDLVYTGLFVGITQAVMVYWARRTTLAGAVLNG